MQKLLQGMSFILLTGMFLSLAEAGSITYHINDYPAVEKGYNISGSITTDGWIGRLDGSHITAWTWTLTKHGSSIITISSTDAGAFVASDGNVFASSTDITMGPPVGSFNEFQLIKPALGYYDLYYVRSSGDDSLESDDFGVFLDTYGAFEVYPPLGPPAIALPDTNTWIIASVPEPSTFVIAAVGCLGLIARRRVGRNYAST